MLGPAAAPRGASPFVGRAPRQGNRPPLNPSSSSARQARNQSGSATSPREEDDKDKPTGEDHGSAPTKPSPQGDAMAAVANAKGETGSIEQAHAMIRVLAAQADEARADKTAMWEQTRNDARAMAQVAKNIEGNQGVLAKVVTTLEAQLVSARAEKDAALDAARADKKTWERLLRESERQLREVEKQRDRAQASAVEANNARKAAQEALEAARRADSEVLRAVQAEKAAMARELKDLRAAANADLSRASSAHEEVHKVASGVEALQAALGVGAYAEGGVEGIAAALREARDARDEAERAKEMLRQSLQEELMEAVNAKEEALAQLASARAGAAPEVQRLQALLEATQAEVQRERQAADDLRRDLDEAKDAREKLLVQERLSGASLSSREREHSQQLGAKEVQVTALERELSTMAGQLVAAQAEVKAHTGTAAAAEEKAVRERSMLMDLQQALEADKAELQTQLRASEHQKGALLEQLSQNAADREFCFEMIKELKGQISAAYSGAS